MSEAVFVSDYLIETGALNGESNLFTGTVKNLHCVYELNEETG
jgi:hypothetical protein